MEHNTSIETGRAIGGALCIALLLKLFLFDFMITEGQSMVPAIKPGSILVVNKLAYGLRLPWSEDYLLWWAMPEPGDVVVFYTPFGEIAVKRCTGLTENQTFMALGDNSLQSYDSRAYGPIPLRNILGKVLLL
ncbi:MAG: signal peptidase I [Treponema sp.]|jgi:signal peptidase I|nr:signal peptidase I [Treponema sp.]